MARKSQPEPNTAAIAHEPGPTELTTEEGHHLQVEPVRPEPTTSQGATATTAHLGIYLAAGELTDAKAAYLTDWNNGGAADTFGRWVAAALLTHAARTPKQRAEKANPEPRTKGRPATTRSFVVPADVLVHMRQAITADQHNDRWLSDSAWCAEAIATAVETARTANGGTLPTPPERLPHRLAR